MLALEHECSSNNSPMFILFRCFGAQFNLDQMSCCLLEPVIMTYGAGLKTTHYNGP